MPRQSPHTVTSLVQEAYEIIRQRPGLSYMDLARELGRSWGTMEGILTTMEYAGLLIAEDNYHQLWPFEP